MVTWTRRDYVYLKECSYREYYGQFVTDPIREAVANAIGRERICESTDPFFNDIPLARWDDLPWFYSVDRVIAGANGTGGVSPSDKVCVMKEAAQQIREEGNGLCQPSA
jgi:hypothetical protein